MFERMRDRKTDFWMWFASAEAHARAALRGRDQQRKIQLVDDVSRHFDKADDTLGFEMGVAPDGVCEFCVSANGVRDNFERAEAFADAAPDIPGWRIFAFKRRHTDWPEIAVDGKVMTASAIAFVATPHGNGGLDIDLWFDAPDVLSDSDLEQLSFLFLDCALGEYDVATGVGDVTPHRGVNPKAQPFADLAQAFDDWKARRLRRPA